MCVCARYIHEVVSCVIWACWCIRVYNLHCLPAPGDDKVNFTTSDGSMGRKMNNQWTRDTLLWEPKYSSFAVSALK
eukprot:1176668-Prorocentrum_minimum.AAC.5